MHWKDAAIAWRRSRWPSARSSIAPGERTIAERIVRGYAAQGVSSRAHAYLDALGEINEPDLLRLAAELRAEAGEHEVSRGLFARLLAREPHLARTIGERGAALATSAPDAALVHVESAAETLLLHGDFAAAAEVYQKFLHQQPGHVAASLRLVEICVDGDLDTVVAAQTALTDAYLAAGRGADARAVAEDLVATHPGDAAHVDRLRRALVLSGEPDVERAIAERLATGASEAAEPRHRPDRRAGEPAAPAPGRRSRPQSRGRTARRCPSRRGDARPAGDTRLAPAPAGRADRTRSLRPRSDRDRSRGHPRRRSRPGRRGGAAGDKDAPEIDLSDALAGLTSAPPKAPRTERAAVDARRRVRRLPVGGGEALAGRRRRAALQGRPHLR